MTSSSKFEQVVSLVNEIVLKEFGEFEKAHPSHSLKNLLDPQFHDAKVGDLSPAELKNILRSLVQKRHGKASFKKDDMLQLDKLTRWMKYIPGGTAYRKSLAKYLRSKSDKRPDPFKDFRKYNYDNIDDTQALAEMPENNPKRNNDSNEEKGKRPTEHQPITFYHGTSRPMKPGSLVLPPSQTGKQSEKDRKKNLDVVFFSTSPRSALIYAGRAAQSLGGKAQVYVVEPQGPVSVLNNTPGTEVYVAKYAKVVRPASKEELAKKKSA